MTQPIVRALHPERGHLVAAHSRFNRHIATRALASETWIRVIEWPPNPWEPVLVEPLISDGVGPRWVARGEVVDVEYVLVG